MYRIVGDSRVGGIIVLIEGDSSVIRRWKNLWYNNTPVEGFPNSLIH